MLILNYARLHYPFGIESTDSFQHLELDKTNVTQHHMMNDSRCESPTILRGNQSRDRASARSLANEDALRFDLTPKFILHQRYSFLFSCTD